jgi:hypothetical protein
MSTSLERLRIGVPGEEVVERGTPADYFDVLANNQGLTEEYLYAHQPASDNQIAVYSTNTVPIGRLDETETLRSEFSVIQGPVIIVARKGYAGRPFVVEDDDLIVHEDAYAIRPKTEHTEKIVLAWFAGHYSFEFQANRTSMWGIGDFPRERMRAINVVIPTVTFQDRAAALYARRDRLIASIAALKGEAEERVARAAGV